jgi:hypothetical protein
MFNFAQKFGKWLVPLFPVPEGDLTPVRPMESGVARGNLLIRQGRHAFTLNAGKHLRRSPAATLARRGRRL